MSGLGHPFKWPISPCCLSAFVSHQILCARNSVLCIHTQVQFYLVNVLSSFSLLPTMHLPLQMAPQIQIQKGSDHTNNILEVTVPMPLGPRCFNTILSFIWVPFALFFRTLLFTMLSKASHAQRGPMWCHSYGKSKRVHLMEVKSTGY